MILNQVNLSSQMWTRWTNSLISCFKNSNKRNKRIHLMRAMNKTGINHMESKKTKKTTMKKRILTKMEMEIKGCHQIMTKTSWQLKKLKSIRMRGKTSISIQIAKKVKISSTTRIMNQNRRTKIVRSCLITTKTKDQMDK
jgi:hypothetical protein